MKKKTIKIFIICALIMFFGWIGNLFFGRYLTPVLIRTKAFSRLEIFNNDNKNTTIINKTEKVVVREDDSISEIASSAVYSVVNIFSYQKKEEITKKTALLEEEKGYIGGVYGAGTILTNDGMIVTSRENIIEKNADYKVATLSGNILDAKLLGIDDFTNLAYFKVEGFNLTTIPFSSSSEMNSGKKIILIGQLSGLQKTYLTDATLSGFDESFNLIGGGVSSSEKLEGVLNININDGEKYVGGPVINYSGELLAISSVITIDGEKKYFQIPAGIIKDSMQKIVENRIDQVAKLGIYYISINPYYKNLKDLPVEKGALIYSSTGKQGLAILDESPAEKAGLKIGDIILSIDGNEINSTHPLSNFISQYEKGGTATLNVLRDGGEVEITVEF